MVDSINVIGYLEFFFAEDKLTLSMFTWGANREKRVKKKRMPVIEKASKINFVENIYDSV